MGALVRHLSAVTVLAAAVFLVACALGGGAASTAIDPDDNGKTVAVPVGQQLMLSLPSNPSTGYQWSLAATLPPQLVTAAETFESSGTPGLVGAGGTQVFTYSVVRAGSGVLTLVYARPWEKGVSPVETYTVTVSAK